ncbi:S8 family peptidase [Micromonospora avicenniae]|uniref:Serine protease, subtilisin family n=1 Tax=Micromonospora avicenniae TaxID=1198245 RepID=A0A1N7BMP0_9ACTN|nr:S8 family serine peptidase [Micromonospora avicenniae]SIR52600.1 Serine protease, subtilisin family [Micromonospora avicenniae]
MRAGAFRAVSRAAVALCVAGALVASAARAQAAGKGWELDALSVPAAHNISKGDGVTVAVIDSGIRRDHPVLDGRASEGPDFLGENDQKESWYGSHGTSMASHVLDVAPKAKVLGLRAIRDREDPDYQTWEESMARPNPQTAHAVRNAIRYAADHGARVISISLGTEDPFTPYDEGEAQAIQYALSKGVVVVASAGNDGDAQNLVAYPVGYPGVIGVAASTPSGGRAYFSTVHSYVDVAAPGVDIWGADVKSKGRVSEQGSSPAGALTAGVAALIVAKYPKLAPRQVADILQSTASHPDRHDPKTGYGVVNAAKALRAAGKVKAQPYVLPVNAEGAGGHFGPGDDGTPRRVGQPIDVAVLVVAVVLGLVALGMILGGVLLVRGGRRARRRSPGPLAAGTPPPQW